ncbi:MAG: hypothetical protein FWC36_08855 [Spirochaetes bacterium]|nr:hypothetical protein [Spirochaetota bacterium]
MRQKTMLKKKLCMGMLIMVLAFGMMAIGCDNSGNNGYTNILDLFNFNTGNLNAQALELFGRSQADFDAMVAAAGGGWQGWVIRADELMLAWTDRSLSNFNAVATQLDTWFTELGSSIEDGRHSSGGMNYDLVFYSVNSSEDGFFIPAGLMRAVFFD